MLEAWALYLAAACCAYASGNVTAPAAQSPPPTAIATDRTDKSAPGGNPYAAYESGRFEAAFEGFADLQAKDPKDVGLMLNLGASLYRLKDYAGAQKALALAAEHGNPEERQQALYDMGNCAFKQHHLEEAVEHFKGALGLDPNDQDAQHNLQVAQQVLRQQQNKPQQDADKKDAPPQPSDPNSELAPDKGAPQEDDQSSHPAPQPADTPPAMADAQKDASQKAEPDPSSPATDAHKTETDEKTDPSKSDLPKPEPSPEGKQAASPSGPTDHDPKKMTRVQAEHLLDAMGESRPRHEKPSDEATRRAPGGKDW